MATKLTRSQKLVPASLSELSAAQQEQLRAAGKRYDGQDLSAAERLQAGGEEGVSFHGYLEITVLTDEHGAPAYDWFAYMVDSGTIFKAGTTDVVAEIIQFGLECEDPALRTLLESAETA